MASIRTIISSCNTRSITLASSIGWRRVLRNLCLQFIVRLRRSNKMLDPIKSASWQKIKILPAGQTSVALWHWTCDHKQMVLTSTQNVYNMIPVRSQWWWKIICRISLVLRTTTNIRIYCPWGFRVSSGVKKSYSLKYGWESLSSSSNCKVKEITSKLNNWKEYEMENETRFY